MFTSIQDGLRFRRENKNFIFGQKKRRVFDTFNFFNELDLLELRLNILNDVVDYFVITESVLTHSGKEKPLYFQQNRSRFNKFEHKIVYNLIDYVPDNFDYYLEKRPYHTNFSDIDKNCELKFIDIPVPYQRVLYERDCTAYGLLKLEKPVEGDDIILSSDLDEIPNPKILADRNWINPEKVYMCLQLAFFYKLNWLYYPRWRGTRIASWNRIKSDSMNNLRDQLTSSIPVRNAGWHWSWLGDEDNFRAKMSAQPETSFNNEDNLRNVGEKIAKGLDPLNRPLKLKKVKVGDKFPEYLRENLDYYSKYLAK